MPSIKTEKCSIGSHSADTNLPKRIDMFMDAQSAGSRSSGSNSSSKKTAATTAAGRRGQQALLRWHAS